MGTPELITIIAALAVTAALIAWFVLVRKHPQDPLNDGAEDRSKSRAAIRQGSGVTEEYVDGSDVDSGDAGDRFEDAAERGSPGRTPDENRGDRS